MLISHFLAKGGHMLPIFIISSKPKALEQLITGSLSKMGTVMRLASKEIHCPGAPDYLVCSSTAPEQLDVASGLAVLCDPPVKKLVLSKGTVPILLSSDRRAVRLLKGCENPAVCCGCSAKDSITMSSRSGGRLLIGLQREIASPLGHIIEPAEYSFADPGGDIQKLMLCAAVLVEVGCSDTSEICPLQ